jgi:hypothetical protein
MSGAALQLNEMDKPARMGSRSRMRRIFILSDAAMLHPVSLALLAAGAVWSFHSHPSIDITKFLFGVNRSRR